VLRELLELLDDDFEPLPDLERLVVELRLERLLPLSECLLCLYLLDPLDLLLLQLLLVLALAILSLLSERLRRDLLREWLEDEVAALTEDDTSESKNFFGGAMPKQRRSCLP